MFSNGLSVDDKATLLLSGGSRESSVSIRASTTSDVREFYNEYQYQF